MIRNAESTFAFSILNVGPRVAISGDSNDWRTHVMEAKSAGFHEHTCIIEPGDVSGLVAGLREVLAEAIHAAPVVSRD